MKLRFLIAFLIAGTVALASVAHAQVHSTECTVVMQFVGESDRLIFPVIIGTSREDAETFRKHVFVGSYFEYAHVDIVSSSAMEHICGLPQIRREIEKTSSAQSNTNIAGLRVSVKVSEREIVTLLTNVEGSAFLESVESTLASYPEVEAKLSEIHSHLIRAKNDNRQYSPPSKDQP